MCKRNTANGERDHTHQQQQLGAGGGERGDVGGWEQRLEGDEARDDGVGVPQQPRQRGGLDISQTGACGGALGCRSGSAARVPPPPTPPRPPTPPARTQTGQQRAKFPQLALHVLHTKAQLIPSHDAHQASLVLIGPYRLALS